MKRKVKTILIPIIIVLILIIISGLIYKNLNSPEIIDTENFVDTLKSLSDYGISLSESDTKLYKEEYDKLESNLLSDEIDFKEYSRSVAKLFIIDLYTINTKNNKYDVGGIEFVLPEARENYSLNLTNTMYKYVEDNLNNNRVQELPEVKSVEIIEENEYTFTIKEEKKDYEGYKYKISIEYVEELGYDKEVEVIVINKDGKMYVVEKN